MADSDPIVIDLYDDLVMGAVKIIRRTFRVAMPARVRNAVRATTRTGVEFAVRFLAYDRTAREDPPIDDLPIVLPRGGGYGLHFDVREGDPCVVFACDGPVSGFYATGETVTPQRTQGHDYGCGVALPGGRVSSTVVPTPPPNNPGEGLVGAEDGSATLIFRGAGLPSAAELGSVSLVAAGPLASIQIGSLTSAVPVACEPQVRANLVALNTAVQAWVPVPADGGASLKPVILAWANALQSMADSKVRVDGP